MPGENLHKLTKAELKELRRIVRKVYGERNGLTPEQAAQVYTNRECDALIDSLLPDTVEKLREIGLNSGWAERKKFYGKSKILGLNGTPLLRDG